MDVNFTYNAGDVTSFTANCPAGMGIISGGGFLSLGEIFINKNYGGTSWTIGVDNFNGSIGGNGDVVANCSTGVSVTAPALSAALKRASEAASARKAAYAAR